MKTTDPLVSRGAKVVTWEGDRGVVTSAKRDRRSERKEYVVQIEAVRDHDDFTGYYSHGEIVPEAEAKAAGGGPWRWDNRNKRWRSQEWVARRAECR